MKIELLADLISKNRLIVFAGKIVEVKQEKKTCYIFEYEGEEFKIQKRFGRVKNDHIKDKE